MRQGSNSRRPRSRGNGRRHPSGRGHSVESNGPDVKIRGTAQHVLEKYLALAHDASVAGDRVAAESYYQFADHYHRVINGDPGGGPNSGQERGPREARPAAAPEPGAGEQPDVALQVLSGGPVPAASRPDQPASEVGPVGPDSEPASV